MKILVSIYIWFFYGLSFAFSIIFAFLVFLVTFPFDKHRKAPNAVMMTFGQSMVWLNPMWKIHHINLDKLKKGPKGKLYVSNHQSFIDMPLLATMPVNLKWLSKKELFKIPVAGWLMKICGHISVDRQSKTAYKALENIVEPIKSGVSVMIFPEGTRSRIGKMKPFKKGAFYAAKDNDFVIQPVLVEGAYKLLPPDTWIMNPKGNLYISALDPVDSKDFDSVESLLEHVHKIMLEESLRLQALDIQS